MSSTQEADAPTVGPKFGIGGRGGALGQRAGLACANIHHVEGVGSFVGSQVEMLHGVDGQPAVRRDTEEVDAPELPEEFGGEFLDLANEASQGSEEHESKEREVTGHDFFLNFLKERGQEREVFDGLGKVDRITQVWELQISKSSHRQIRSNYIAAQKSTFTQQNELTMNVKKYIVELIGTFFLVLTIVMAANNGSGAMAPIAIGAMLMVMVYAGSHISGAHYNPAVTLAVIMRGRMERRDVPYYLAAQFVGALLAASAGGFLLGCQGITDIRMQHSDWMCALVGEFLGTFALVFVILNVCLAKPNSGNSHYGLSIGFVVTAAAYSLGSLSGGAFNPAVAFGMTVAGMAAWGDIWIYVVANLLGGAAAATVFMNVYEEKQES